MGKKASSIHHTLPSQHYYNIISLPRDMYRTHTKLQHSPFNPGKFWSLHLAKHLAPGAMLQVVREFLIFFSIPVTSFLDD